jgi:hypothetical protein
MKFRLLLAASVPMCLAAQDPAHPAEVKAYIKAWIDHFERAVRLERASVDFATKRSNELRAELSELGKQIDAGTVK